MIILSLDYGERYVGVGITDPDGRLALRHSVIDQLEDSVFEVVRELVRKEGVTKILVGVPVSLDGDETDQTHVSLAFIESLRTELGDDIEVEGVDETLTSVEAAQNINAEGGNKNDEHAEAARMMLESYLRE